MIFLKTLFTAIARNGDVSPSKLRLNGPMHDSAGPQPANFGEVIGYLASYLKSMPDTQNCCSNHLKLSLDYLLAWLRNELVDEQLPTKARGEEWSL